MDRLTPQLPPPPLDPVSAMGLGSPPGMPPAAPSPMGPEMMGLAPAPADPLTAGMPGLPQPMGPDPMQQQIGMGMAMMAEPEPAGYEPDADGDDLEPIYPRWLYETKVQNGVAVRTLKKPKKPTQEYCKAAINTAEMDHGTLQLRFARDVRIYRNAHRNVFEDLDQSDIEVYQTAEPATQVDKICNMISGIDPVIQWDYKNPEEEDTAQSLENAAYHILDRADAFHRNGGNAQLIWEMTWYLLVYGRIYTRVLPDPTDPEFPWDIRLYDPATVFPVWGTKRGVYEVSSVYQESLQKVLQTYVDDPKLEQKLLKKYTDSNGDIQLGTTDTVKEWWNEWYRYVEFGGEVIMDRVEHELGRIPFQFTIGPGEAGSASAALPYNDGMPTAREVKSGFYGGGRLEGQDLAYKGLSFFHHIYPVLQQEEMLFSVLMTSAKQSLNPPVGIESPYDDQPEPISFRTGATNKLRTGEKFVPLLGGAKPTDVGPLMTALREQRVKNMLPDQLFGAMDGGGASGFAVESLIGAAKDRIQPVIAGIEHHLASIIEACMWTFRDFGHLFVDAPTGEFPIPVQGRAYSSSSLTQKPDRPQMAKVMEMLMAAGQGGMPGFADAWNAAGIDNTQIPNGHDDECYLTRQAIMDVGTRPSVKLHSIQLQNLTAMANVAGMLIERKIWSRSHAMDELNIKNPSHMWRQILAEDAQTNPKMLELVAFPQALWESGNVSGFLAYVATVLMPMMQQQMMGQMMPGQDPSGGGGGGMTSIPGGPQTVAGDSQPMVGQAQQTLTGPGNGGSPV